MAIQTPALSAPRAVDAVELLEPHARRSIRSFLRQPPSPDAEAAFWGLLYGRSIVTHATAVAVAAALERSDRRIADVIAGWRPTALEQQPRVTVL